MRSQGFGRKVLIWGAWLPAPTLEERQVWVRLLEFLQERGADHALETLESAYYASLHKRPDIQEQGSEEDLRAPVGERRLSKKGAGEVLWSALDDEERFDQYWRLIQRLDGSRRHSTTLEARLRELELRFLKLEAESLSKM